jgi:hypothetical protein
LAEDPRFATPVRAHLQLTVTGGGTCTIGLAAASDELAERLRRLPDGEPRAIPIENDREDAQHLGQRSADSADQRHTCRFLNSEFIEEAACERAWLFSGEHVERSAAGVPVKRTGKHAH